MKNKLLVLFACLLTLMIASATAQVTDSSAWWAHMTGTVTHGVTLGVYGTQGTPHPNNTSGTRAGGGGNIIDKDGNLWLFGGRGVDEANAGNRGMNDLWKYDITNNQWTWIGGAKNAFTPGPPYGVYGTRGVPGAANWPGGRGFITPVMDTAGDFWVFGGVFGYGENTVEGSLNDLWKYDMTSGHWTWMHGPKLVNQFGSYGTLGQQSPSNVPGARAQYMAWMDKENNIWLFGGNGYGESGAAGPLSDLWKYSIKDTAWTWVAGAKTINQTGSYTGTVYPGARHSLTGWADAAGKIWLFGGTNALGHRFSDLWKFDPVTNQWSFVKGDQTFSQFGVYGTRGVPNIANKPGGRYVMVGWTDVHGHFWMYGGYGYAASGAINYLNDIWRYNPADNIWTWMKGSNTAQVALGAVAGVKTVADPGNTPGYKQVTTSWVDASGNFWLYGGANDNGYNNSLWRLAPEGLPQPGNFLVSKTNVCKTETGVVYRINKVAGATSYEWTYTPATGVTITGSDTSVTLDFSASAGNGTLSVVAKNAGSTSPPRDLAITVNDLPVVSAITGTTSVCVNGTTTLSNTASGGTWLTASASIATVSNGVVTGVSAGTTDISYRMINASNCTTTVSVPVTVNALPVVPAITGTTSVCVNGTTTLANTASGGTWLTASASIATVNNGVVTGISAGTTDISYRVINAGNCTTTVSVPVTVNALPVVPAITGTASVCVNGTTTLSNTASGGTWLTASASIATVTNGVVTGVSAGTTSISYRVINASNCTTTVSVPFTVNALPPISVTPSGARSICQGDSLLITATSGSGVQYEWRRGVTQVGGNSATYYASVAGDYRVTVSNGVCAATSDLVSLSVHALPVATVTASGPVDICEDDSVILTAASVSGVDYQWKDGTTNVGMNMNTYTAGATGSYKVVVTNNSTGCSDSTAPMDVFVYSRPVVLLEPGDTSFCNGGLVLLEVVSPDTGLTYRWKNSSTTISLATAYFLEITETGVYSVVVGRSQVTACEDSTNEVTVTVHPLPVVDITWDDVLLHATPGYDSYQWNTGGQGIAGATDSTYEPSSNGGYSVTVTDENGCSSTSPVYNVTNVSVGDLVAVGAQIQIYPNPANDVVYIVAPVPVTVILSSMDGRLLQQQTNVHMLNIGGYADGVYLLRIMDADGINVRTERIVRQSRQ